MLIYCKKHRRQDLDSCEECDKETANPVYVRGIRLAVWVDRKWLTTDFEHQDVEGGWKELESQITDLVRRHLNQGKASFQVTFEEWDGEPEVEKSAYQLNKLGRS